MPDRRFGRRHAHGFKRRPKQPPHRAEFEFVAERRRSAVRVDVIDLGKADARLAHRHFHRTIGTRPVGVRRGHVIGIARQAVTQNLGVNLRAARLGVLVFLEADDARAFAHHEAVAALVIRTRCLFGRVVEPRRQRARLCKARDPDRADRAFRTARQHDVGVVHHDHARGVADRMHAGRACGDDRVVGAHQSVFDADLPRDEVDQPPVDEVRRDAARPLFGEHPRLAFDARQSADPRTDRTAHTQPDALGRIDQPRIFDRLAGGVDAIDDERIDLALHLVVDTNARIEAVDMVVRFDLARDGAFVAGRVEPRDACRARAAGNDVRPATLDAAPQRGNEAKSRDDDTTHLRSFTLNRSG